MAIYGRSRERWNPTKSKSKTSKNKTYEVNFTGDYDNGGFMLWLNTESIVDNYVVGPKNSIGDDISLAIHGDFSPELVPITASHFQPKALQFGKDGTLRSYVQYTRTLGYGLGFRPLELLNKYAHRDTYISMWLKIEQYNFETSVGHCLGGLYRSIPDPDAPADDETWSSNNPFLLFNINSSGAFEVRIQRNGTDVDRLYYTTDVNHKLIPENQWVHVIVVLKQVQDTGGGILGYDEMVEIFLDGQRSNVQANATNSTTHFNLDAGYLDLLLGNHTQGYEDGNGSAQSEGFYGAIGEFLMFTQPEGTQEDIITMAKFIYEAQREGVFHLHSGIHNSSPRLEQLDLDRDSLYPSNFTLENYTQVGQMGSVDRVSSRSVSRYTEGFNTSDTDYEWSENASQYFQNVSTGVLPHLRLHYTDTLITNGNWYSDARSEFFPEDLAADGFVVDDQASDELYREHFIEQSTTPFVEFDIPEAYKDCFVIEIPIPNSVAVELGTDLGSSEVKRINTATNSVTAAGGGNISNMAYYNFSEQKWERSGGSSYSLYSATPGDTMFVDANNIGFSPMTGIVVPVAESIAEKVVPMYGLPTSDFGFPTAQVFSPTDGQTFNLSRYIDQPVILEGWEIKTSVVPKVGYQDQTSTFFSGMPANSKSPFHYGGHGEAAVFFDHKKRLSGFDSIKIDYDSKEYYIGQTVPITTADDVTGIELEPSIDTVGLVTHGTTAFLLKKPKIVDDVGLRDASIPVFREEKQVSKFTNLDEYGYWSATNDPQELRNQTTTYGEHPDGDFYLAETPEFNTAFDNTSNLQLVGWLQHIYHNDEKLSDYSSRRFWTRENDTENAYRFTKGTNLVTMMGKENSTYVADLLYTNTEEVDFNVRGNTKVVGKIPKGMPITNFFIQGTFESDSNTAPHYAVSTFSETTFNIGDGCLSNHDIIPRYGAAEYLDKDIWLPKINMPMNRTNATDPVDVVHSSFRLYDSIVDDSVVILNPTDELVLGIQNSISSTFASQQIDASGFIRWGRTSLSIPAQDSSTNTSYLRLFVKKTRRDKDFNIVADSSNYNANVNRDLGDIANGDQWKTSNLSIYSGSIADDIVGPTYLTPPEHYISVPSSLLFSRDLSALSSNQIAIQKLSQWLRDAYNGVMGIFRRLVASDYDVIPQVADDRPDWTVIAINLYDDANTTTWDSLYASDPSAALDAITLRYIFQYYSVSDIDAAILNWATTDPILGASSYSYSGYTNLSDLGIPAGNIVLDWTQLSRSVFSYGGPLPAALFQNDYDQFIPMESFHGFVTRYHEEYNPSTPNDTILHPGIWNGYVLGFYGGIYDNYRPEGGWLLEELNPNVDKPALSIINSQRLRSVEECGAVSAWYSRFRLPYFNSYFPGKVINALTVEFRLIKIDTGEETGSTIRNPIYADGTKLAIGDFFFFNKNHEVIKIDLSTSPTIAATQLFPETTTVYIVGGGGTPEAINLVDVDLDDTSLGVQNLKVYSFSDPEDGTWMTWGEVWDGIKQTLINQKIQNSALLYDVIDTAVDDIFRLVFPIDPVVQATMNVAKDEINQYLNFELCGIDLSSANESGLAGVFPNGFELYGVMKAQTEVGWDGAPTQSYDDYASVPAWYSNGGRIFDSSGEPVDIGSDDTIDVGYAYSRWVDRLWGAFYFMEDTSAFGSGTYPNDDAGKIAIQYDNISFDSTEYRSQDPTFGMDNKLIDRKVLFRNTEKTKTTADVIKDYTGTTIGKASSYGGLKRAITLIDDNKLYWDSMMTVIDVRNSIDLKNYTPPRYAEDGESMGWLLEEYDKKDVNLFSSGVITAGIDDSNPGLYDSNNSNSIEYTYEVEGNTISFPGSSSDGATIYDSILVTNYFQRDFRGLRDFSGITLKNLVYCFGNGKRGKHVIRPSVSIWSSFDPINMEITDFWADELILDPPRGMRFGLLGYNEKQRYIFSNSSYGQFRDMFEQSLDSKMSNFETNSEVYGAPVVVNPINPVNAEVPKLMENTMRYNKTANATIVKPYIEDNYEAIPNPVNLKAETLRVDVAGSIKTKAVLAPGNVASNIRRR